ncbi:glutathione S-transferase family protein [Pseudonocardia alni]|jgi:putative glutathione S-transferase|uniref:glutathione S-transferase family protein n=1 Tax=Pseudonocardia TaxID=1847 RepID=UPI000916EE5A|nr:glutathione S-transferase C-terminal domain-containing protein [Pseudonocardia sp. SID8383]MYW74567.1 glutathione S-transferase family protein [Pseudonocardia sp. SID8383]OJG06894.1 Glutathionyl-hydroquinone reductase YqjG [Pseudonocardia autotrophica]WFG42852.1 glutathione S-transferase family protein [Pseudonocardia alni]
MGTDQDSGEFVREALGVAERITADGSSPWPVEAGRYRLVGARACPWANRVIITRRLLGLEDAISMGIAGPLHDERSWRFHLDPGNVDPVLGIEYLREAYEKAVPGYDEGVTVPAMVEVASGKVVTNEYALLERDLSTQWRGLHRDGAPDLWTDPEAIDEIGEGIFHDVNNGVYKCGFASSQRAYDRAYDALWSRMDELSEHLSTRRYLVGDSITQADIRLWVTLVRFDAAYHGHFKANRHKLTELPVLWAYARDLFQTPGFGDTIDFEQVKQHYYGVHASVNPTGIVPKGPDTAGWTTAHGREELGGRPFGDGTPPGPPPESERVPAVG